MAPVPLGFLPRKTGSWQGDRLPSWGRDPAGRGYVMASSGRSGGQVKRRVCVAVAISFSGYIWLQWQLGQAMRLRRSSRYVPRPISVVFVAICSLCESWAGVIPRGRGASCFFVVHNYNFSFLCAVLVGGCTLFFFLFV